MLLRKEIDLRRCPKQSMGQQPGWNWVILEIRFGAVRKWRGELGRKKGRAPSKTGVARVSTAKDGQRYSSECPRCAWSSERSILDAAEWRPKKTRREVFTNPRP